MTPLRLFETMRAESGRVRLLDLHLARLAESAVQLGFRLNLGEARDAVVSQASGVTGASRLRLTLGHDGNLDLALSPLDGTPWRTAIIAPWPLVEAGSLLCRHKTTRREHYERPYGWARARGADEAILLDRHGAVVEGTRSTVWVERDGRLLTPPLSAGGLPGVDRAHRLATDSRASEAPLRTGDLHASTHVYLSNALRGLQPIRLLLSRPSPS